jgi:hypothetical protein
MVIATLMSVLIHRPVIASLTPPGTELRRPLLRLRCNTIAPETAEHFD